MKIRYSFKLHLKGIQQLYDLLGKEFSILPQSCGCISVDEVKDPTIVRWMPCTG